MLNSLKSWTISISTFVVLTTFLEIILPEGNIRNFVKVIIGILIIFVILNPFINLTKSNIDIDMYSEAFSSVTGNKDYSSNNISDIEKIQEKQTLDMYISQIKELVKRTISQTKEYKLNDINIVIDTNEKSKNYGSIDSLDILLGRAEDMEVENSSININLDEIKVDMRNDDKKDNKFSENEIYYKDTESTKGIKNILSKELQISSDKIQIKILDNKQEGGD